MCSVSKNKTENPNTTPQTITTTNNRKQKRINGVVDGRVGKVENGQFRVVGAGWVKYGG